MRKSIIHTFRPHFTRSDLVLDGERHDSDNTSPIVIGRETKVRTVGQWNGMQSSSHALKWLHLHQLQHVLDAVQNCFDVIGLVEVVCVNLWISERIPVGNFDLSDGLRMEQHQRDQKGVDFGAFERLVDFVVYLATHSSASGDAEASVGVNASRSKNQFKVRHAGPTTVVGGRLDETQSFDASRQRHQTFTLHEFKNAVDVGHEANVAGFVRDERQLGEREVIVHVAADGQLFD